MRKSISLIPAALAVVVFAGATFAQQGSPSIGTATVFYVKVAPDKRDTYHAFMKSGDGAKAMRGFLKASPSLASISLRVVTFPGYPKQEATHVMVFSHSGPMKWPAGWQDVFRAEAGMTSAEHLTKSREFSEYAGSVMVHLHHATGKPAVEGEVVVLDRIKFKRPAAEYHTLMRETSLPLAEQRVKDGGMMSWSYSHLVYPAGSSLPSQATVVRRYKDMESAVAAGFDQGASAARFAKVFPNGSYLQYMDRLRECGEMVRRDMETIVAVFRK